MWQDVKEANKAECEVGGTWGGVTTLLPPSDASMVHMINSDQLQ